MSNEFDEIIAQERQKAAQLEAAKAENKQREENRIAERERISREIFDVLVEKMEAASSSLAKAGIESRFRGPTTPNDRTCFISAGPGTMFNLEFGLMYERGVPFLCYHQSKNFKETKKPIEVLNQEAGVRVVTDFVREVAAFFKKP